MSWRGLMDDWAGEPRPVTATPIRDLVLCALAEAVVTRRLGPEFCKDCEPGALCADHREDLAAAREYEAAYMRIRRIGADGAVLELTGGLT